MCQIIDINRLIYNFKEFSTQSHTHNYYNHRWHRIGGEVDTETTTFKNSNFNF